MAKRPQTPKAVSQFLDKMTSFSGKVDSGLDQVKKSVQGDLDKLRREKNFNSLSANLYASAETGFKKDLDEIGIRGDSQKEYLAIFQRTWIERSMGSRSAEILKSPELAAMNSFITDMENLPKLKKVIDSAEPMSMWESMLKGFAGRIPGLDKFVDKFFGPVLASLGLGSLISKKKKAAKKAAKKVAGSAKKPTVAVGVPPAPAVKPTEVAKKGQEKMKLPGSTLFLGDSLTLGMTSRSKDIFQIEGPVKSVAESGKSARWGLKEVKKMAAQKPSPLKDYNNAVVLFGTNDLLAYSAQDVISDLREIYETLKKAGVKDVYAVTIPPIKGYPGYDKAPQANKNRHEINEWILKTASSGLTHHVIDLNRTQSEGGLASNDDREKLGKHAKSGDNLHFDKRELAKIYQRELQTGTNKSA